MKKLFKNMALVIAAGAMLVGLAACGSSSDGGTTAEGGSPDKVYTFSWAHSSSTNDRLALATEKMAAELLEASDGRLVIEHYPASQLGAEREILEGVTLGTVDFGVISSGVVASFSDAIQVTSVPYMIDERELGWAVYDGEFGAMLGARTEQDANWKFLGWAENSLRMFSNRTREIQTPADMAGLKIRPQENDIHMQIVNDLGASATPVNFAELYAALQQGMVDGQENGVALTYSMGFHEVVKYMTYYPHIYDPYIVVMSTDAWNSLPPDLQELVQEYALKFCQYEREFNKENDETFLAEMEAGGLNVYYPTDEQKAEFVEATSKVEDSVRAKIGDELVDAYIQAVEDAKAAQ